MEILDSSTHQLDSEIEDAEETKEETYKFPKSRKIRREQGMKEDVTLEDLGKRLSEFVSVQRRSVGSEDSDVQEFCSKRLKREERLFTQLKGKRGTTKDNRAAKVEACDLKANEKIRTVICFKDEDVFKFKAFEKVLIHHDEDNDALTTSQDLSAGKARCFDILEEFLGFRSRPVKKHSLHEEVEGEDLPGKSRSKSSETEREIEA